MESWIIFALIASLSAGSYNFLQKMQSEWWKISDMWFIVYTYVYLSLFGIIALGLSWKQLDYSNTVLLYSFLITFIFIIIVKTRLRSLRYISTSSYFINYRMFSSALLIFAGMLFFSEQITLKEIIWIIVWFVVFYLLLEKTWKKKKKKSLLAWYWYLIVWIVWMASIQLLAKDFVLKDLDIYSLMFFEWLFGIAISMFLIKWKSVKRVLKIESMKDHLFLLASGSIFSLSVYTNNMAFDWWDVAIVYKIISYSLFIPIILSIIFYNEKVWIKQVIAFILTIISILLFV